MNSLPNLIAEVPMLYSVKAGDNVEKSFLKTLTPFCWQRPKDCGPAVATQWDIRVSEYEVSECKVCWIRRKCRMWSVYPNMKCVSEYEDSAEREVSTECEVCIRTWSMIYTGISSECRIWKCISEYEDGAECVPSCEVHVSEYEAISEYEVCIWNWCKVYTIIENRVPKLRRVYSKYKCGVHLKYVRFIICTQEYIVWFLAPMALHRNITSHSMKNLVFHSLLRWKIIVLPILTTPLIRFCLKRLGECTFWTWEWKG